MSDCGCDMQAPNTAEQRHRHACCRYGRHRSGRNALMADDVSDRDFRVHDTARCHRPIGVTTAVVVHEAAELLAVADGVRAGRITMAVIALRARELVGVAITEATEVLREARDRLMARWLHIVRRLLGKGAFPHQLWFLLEIPGRRLVQPPEQLAERLQLSSTSRVLEIGPGSGFFSRAVAARIPEGNLVLLDLRVDFIARAKQRLSKAQLGNVTGALGDACNLPFRGDAFHAVFLVAVLGETSDPGLCVREVYRVLKPGGILLVAEHWVDPDFVSGGELRALVNGTSFERIETRGPARSYTATFQKPLSNDLSHRRSV